MSEKKRPLTASEQQASQLARLLANPTKAAYIPDAPQVKELRAPKEMMKNVQGSSAGAGSGEFHVYKQARRREYERIRLMEEEDEKSRTIREAEEKRAAAEAISDAKLNKNRAKRAKKRGKRTAKQVEEEDAEEALDGAANKKPKLQQEFTLKPSAAALAMESKDEEHKEEEEQIEQAPRAQESGIRIVDED